MIGSTVSKVLKSGLVFNDRKEGLNPVIADFGTLTDSSASFSTVRPFSLG
jgi:hypothetical protein